MHSREMIARVILGEQKFVNTEAPKAIADLKCFKCQTAIENIRSFKYHNYACGNTGFLEVMETKEKLNYFLPGQKLPKSL